MIWLIGLAWLIPGGIMAYRYVRGAIMHRRMDRLAGQIGGPPAWMDVLSALFIVGTWPVWWGYQMGYRAGLNERHG